MIFSFILFYGGCRGLVSFITSHKTCERFSIDNYEIRTHTDIPDTKSSTCLYDTVNMVKSSIFILDPTEKELSRSIEWNNLKKVTECTFPGFRHNPAWNDSISKLPTDHLYSRKTVGCSFQTAPIKPFVQNLPKINTTKQLNREVCV